MLSQHSLKSLPTAHIHFKAPSPTSNPFCSFPTPLTRSWAHTHTPEHLQSLPNDIMRSQTLTHVFECFWLLWTFFRALLHVSTHFHVFTTTVNPYHTVKHIPNHCQPFRDPPLLVSPIFKYFQSVFSFFAHIFYLLQPSLSFITYSNSVSTIFVYF